MNNNCMNMLRFSLSILVGTSLVCLNLSQAQTFNIPTNTGAPPISITPNPPTIPASSSTPTSSPTLAAPTSNDATPAKKYYEFKSICVRDEQIPVVLSANVKEKRLALIQTKLEKAQTAKNKELTQQIKALQIREYFKQENYVKAEELFLRESINLTETDRMLIATDIDLRKQLPKLAKNNLNKYLETHRSDVLVLEKLAEVYITLGYYTDAVMAYEDLQKMNPKKSYTEALCQTATFNADHSNITLYCHQLQKKQPDNNLADIYLGISYRDQEKYKEAIKSFEKSMKGKPTEFASSCLAESYYLNKEFEKAIVQFETSVKISPSSRRARLGLANTYLKQNLFKEALEQFKESCKLGLLPLIEMSAAANTLRTQKSDLANLYFDEMQKCKK
jgi:tetratricopeptide (TPR) repeat protein